MKKVFFKFVAFVVVPLLILSTLRVSWLIWSYNRAAHDPSDDYVHLKSVPFIDDVHSGGGPGVLYYRSKATPEAVQELIEGQGLMDIAPFERSNISVPDWWSFLLWWDGQVSSMRYFRSPANQPDPCYYAYSPEKRVIYGIEEKD